MPLPNPVIARVQALARSSLYGDLRALIEDLREVSIADLLVAGTPEEMFRTQGRVGALDSLSATLEQLRMGEDIEADEPQANVVIPNSPADPL